MRDLSSMMDRRALAANCESFPRLHRQTMSVLAVGDSSCSVVWLGRKRGDDVKGDPSADSRGVDGFASSSESGMPLLGQL